MRAERHPLYELTAARLLELVREPSILFWVFGFPILLAIGLGIAFRNKPPERAFVGILSQEESVLRPMLAAATDLELVILEPDRADEALARTKVDVIVALGTSSTSVVYRSDPDQPKSQWARLLTDAALQRARGRQDVISSTNVQPTAIGRRYIDFLVPGLIGLNLMGSSMWGIGYAIVDARARRLMKRFAATPMRPSWFLWSYVLSRIVLLVAELAVLMAFAVLAFDVTVRGSILDLVVVSTVGSLSFAGLALLVAARPRKTEVASGWMNFVMMPMWILSGSFFSYERFPEVAHPFVRALPLTALNDALRGVMNDATPLSNLGLELFVLGLWGALSFVLALKIFRWQ